MRVQLHDSDLTKFPNLALMKLSAWHKERGDQVEWLKPEAPTDLIYSSKVFSFTPDDPLLPPHAVRGGVGYGDRAHCLTLPDEIEHICPDYQLYGRDYSLGFTTRGCPNDCWWCGVPGKEGGIRKNADIEEFVRHKKAVLLDNNPLADDWGIDQIAKMGRLGLEVDFNQGLDARRIDDAIARRLAAVRWLFPVRLACDHSRQLPSLIQAVTHLRWHNVTPRRYFCYMLVTDIADAVERVRVMKSLNIDPYAQAYRDLKGTPPTEEQRHFCRWVNQKAEFKSRTWEDYRLAKMGEDQTA